ncbi:hypothetical protein LXA43DRAFT_1098018 [Ganoderma leucocontextum]|nr:hypothetical protein LXA43DRAFT_1098018 [Ganoderma leucocontextum]
MPTATTSQTVTDPVFFFSIVEFQVDGVLFGLPNYVYVTAAEFRDFLRCLLAPLPLPQAAKEAGGPSDSDSDAVRAAYMKRWVNALKLATRWKFEDVRDKGDPQDRRDGRPPQSSSPSRASLTTSRGSSPGALRDLADTKVMTPLNKEDYEILGLDLAIKRLIEDIFGAEFATDVKMAADAA